MSWLKQRLREPEIQDQPDLDSRLLRQALDGLQRINFVSQAYLSLWSPIRALARERGVSQLSFLDVACGAGDIAAALYQRGRRDGLKLEMEGCDLNPRTIAYAQEAAQKRDAKVHFFTWDALREDFPRTYDVVACSLFLHHLSDGDAVLLLQRMARAATRAVLVCDLVRSAGGMVLAYLGTRLLFASHVNRVDAIRSVRAAFTLEEFAALVERAGLSDATFQRCWPYRFVMTWKHS